jgi:RimJ/RimL family protein N-acetyltransferase
MGIHSSLMESVSGARGAVDWRRGLPDLTDGVVRLREVRAADAATLLRHLNDPAVLEYLTPCPDTIDGFRRFVQWTRTERRRGLHVCYGIVPPGITEPIGIIQLWPIERDLSTAEWGFVVGHAYWGRGLFVRSARLFLDAVFLEGVLGRGRVRRLEARAAEANERGNGLLRKLGASPEGVLREAFTGRHGPANHILWSLLASEWTARRARERRAS